ncbi:MAG: phosphoribosylformylglycinamidine cyclo-ligase [Spirochaetes bacterium GWF1_31_7]|nr:MAG: phosphoribosylformylglycinamidine cyclo-ligase [Spirochaetes bacterium GWE1_32_154]OHD50983.1 MAG: phosphoribosylformylglycinamidine cyclo-ligase [Spirochaetes bacterium GWE2_31_10]OHD51637.1 MAG: phosphoribosylformylglycinamidine cyclo-ligase [Spirochaetes bacterium GWF1_31_7]HBD94982.1 phosphoribosylformylglycinamidine cyclo-ligase [Spirochaetia bacterium]HBI36710.1 phosphoribosylformylglycinamidine cyclo-ligase [Spirochaetia bacterium]
MSRYNARGVSSKKEDVHNAIKNLDAGLYPGAFCKIIPDFLGNDPDYCTIMHADGAGTKSSLAYMYYKETGDLSVFKGIAMDSIVMNIDDLLCVGCTSDFLVSSTIGRNSKYIPGEVIHTIIQANEEIAEEFSRLGIKMIMTGGETADVGDLVRTIIVDTTVTARMKKEQVINAKNTKPGHVIIGLSSTGKANYEKTWNAGMGSNGLTSARHDIFAGVYRTKYPESYDNCIPEELAYSGKYLLTDTIKGLPHDIGRSVLSPTRTYAPVIKEVISNMGKYVSGIIHCSGGAQTKCLKFGSGLHYIKDNLFDIPVLFKTIQEVSGTDYKEMYQVFNMGHRMEIYAPEDIASDIIALSQSFSIDAQIIGRIEKNKTPGNRLTLTSPQGVIEYNE